MDKNIIILIVIAALLLLTMTVKKEAEIEQVGVDGTPLGAVARPDLHRGQVFLPPRNFQITKVALYFSNQVGSVDVPVDIEIQEVEGNYPNGVIVASAAINRNMLSGTGFQLIEINFNQEMIEQSKRYAILVKPQSHVTGNSLRVGIAGSDVYADGHSLWYDGAWGADFNDILFFVYGIDVYNDFIEDKNNYLSGQSTLSALQSNLASWISG